jgi:hypothetical protein
MLAEDFACVTDPRRALLVKESVKRDFDDIGDGVSAMGLKPFDALLGAALHVCVERYFGGFSAWL